LFKNEFMMDRATWLRRILEATRDLADGRYQERVWVRGEGPEVDSSTEALIRLVDDYDLAAFIAEAAKEGWVSNEQLAALRNLDAALARYAPGDRCGDDAARIASREWLRMRKLAKAALYTFTTPATGA
jgi:hypothetical protein